MYIQRGCGGQRDDLCPRLGGDCIVLRRAAHNLKLLNSLFLEFSIKYFQTVVDRETIESKTVDEGRLLYPVNSGFIKIVCRPTMSGLNCCCLSPRTSISVSYLLVLLCYNKPQSALEPDRDTALGQEEFVLYTSTDTNEVVHRTLFIIYKDRSVFQTTLRLAHLHQCSL